jgi:hypothetical protein
LRVDGLMIGLFSTSGMVTDQVAQCVIKATETGGVMAGTRPQYVQR